MPKNPNRVSMTLCPRAKSIMDAMINDPHTTFKEKADVVDWLLFKYDSAHNNKYSITKKETCDENS